MHLQALLGAAVVVSTLVAQAGATIIRPKWKSCAKDYGPVDPATQFNITDVLATIVGGGETAGLRLPGDNDDVLRLDVLGISPKENLGYNNTNLKLATLFATTWEAGVTQYTLSAWLCPSIFPGNTSTPYVPDQDYCPIQVGAFGINVSIPLANIHALATLHTEVRVVDANEPAYTLGCVDVWVSPYDEGSWPYQLFLWFPAAVAMAYWIVTWAARFAAGWVVGADRTDTSEAVMLKWGTMLISGLSGERLGVSAALLRFVTPGLRDIIHHIQFITMLCMIRVNWPQFMYPIVAQSAWANLVWNVSIVSDVHPSAYASEYVPPATEVRKLIDDPSWPLYLNNSAPNRLLDLDRTPDGMRSFARMVGLRPQDLFGTCLSLFMMLAAIIIAFSLFLWILHGLTELLTSGRKRPKERSATPGAPRLSNGQNRNSYISGHSRSSSQAKELYDHRPSTSTDLGVASIPYAATQQPQTQRRTQRAGAPSRWHRTWKRFSPRGEAGAFHYAALYGNLLRLILTFHFPVTTFSVYQLTLRDASTISRAFAALALAFISIMIPAWVLYKISRTPTGKLYDAARTLLSLGTMYNVYEPGKQLYRTLPLIGSLVSGIAIGAGQRSGLAQTIILIIVELATFVATTFWSPWGLGASMGGIMVITSIVRITSIIMTMVISKELGTTGAATEWLTYVILLLNAIVFVFFFLMVCTKITEGMIRLFGGAPFDESNHPIDGGIFAAIMDLDCLNGVRGGKAAARRRRKRDSELLQQNVSVAGSLTTQMMLDRHSQGVARDGYPLVEPNSRSGYYPVQNPTMVPVNEFGGRRSISDHGSIISGSHEGAMLEMWRPSSFHDVQPQPLPSQSEKTTPISSPRFSGGSWSGHAPSIRVTSETPQRPGHTRARSSSAVVEILDSPRVGPQSPPMRSMSTSPHLGMAGPPVYPPTAGVRADRNGQRPPPIDIPGRGSLNNINLEIDENRRARRAAAKKKWFGRTNNVTSDDSDDEPGPSRRRRSSVVQYDDDEDAGRRWIALFRRKPKVLDPRARAENRARKAVAVNQSGALLAGVDAPAPKTFRVQRKGAPAPLLSPPAAERSFRVQRKGQSSEPTSPTPAATPNSLAPLMEDEEPQRGHRRGQSESAGVSSGTATPGSILSSLPPNSYRPRSAEMLLPRPVSGSSFSLMPLDRDRTPRPPTTPSEEGGYGDGMFVPMRPL